MGKQFRSVKGMHDVLPLDEAGWFFVTETFSKSVKLAGYHYLQTPVLEDAELFKKEHSSGADILDEMYAFTDKSGELLALRPEGTPPAVRAYIEHGFMSAPKPVKFYYLAPMFRYDRPQAGRYRQFNQMGFEAFGDSRSEIDAQVISLVWRVYNALGLKNISIHINSIGDTACRPRYEKELVEYYKSNNLKICEKCKIRIKINPLRMLDCKEETCVSAKKSAPQLIDFLDKDCHDHFKAVLEHLDQMEIDYELDPYLVRGLDYYNRTTFEVWPAGETGAQGALGGGGRYDSLVELLGGRPTPAIGFAGGVERTILALEKQELPIPSASNIDVYIAQIGDKAGRACLKVHHDLLKNNISVEGCLDKDSIRNQLKKASDLAVRFSLIIGQKEAYDSSVIIREMKSGAQEVYPQEKIVKELLRRLSSGI